MPNYFGDGCEQGGRLCALICIKAGRTAPLAREGRGAADGAR